ncbi:Retrovirus-related Pol polyprotein from transposon RE2 [Araneus ventricosus]|uniref:Retrovirus-related Pol polyprotein from transposon RE2 n=1 Tax=Araneus ventricosus TaxID=182803 RepID=A0A4Y2EKM7_ARAVE|nr:Retrovirus-related Pol polyprotein from transposon RE2 [Araneus ventricosus]
MNRELKVMYERNVWDLLKPPKDEKILGNRWVYTLNERNEIVTYKARLVAQGFNQIKGESYDKVFSPVVNFSIIRLFFTIFVCLFKWLDVQIDINNAYLDASLDEVIYMSQPKGFVEADKVCRLKRAIYRLHQSSRQWFLEMDDMLNELIIKIN